MVILTLRRCVNNAVYPIGYKQKYLLKHFLMSLLRYVIDGCAKLTLLGLALSNIFTIYTNYNWFKGSINNKCADGNFSTLYAILNPLMTLYTNLLNHALSVLVLCIIMLILDIVHFVYIWKSELSYYLI